MCQHWWSSSRDIQIEMNVFVRSKTDLNSIDLNLTLWELIFWLNLNLQAYQCRAMTFAFFSPQKCNVRLTQPLFVDSELVRDSIIIISGEREGRGKSEKGVRSLFYFFSHLPTTTLTKRPRARSGFGRGGHINKIGWKTRDILYFEGGKNWNISTLCSGVGRDR